jgi:hypothetical protein
MLTEYCPNRIFPHHNLRNMLPVRLIDKGMSPNLYSPVVENDPLVFIEVKNDLALKMPFGRKVIRVRATFARDAQPIEGEFE